ncbi:2-dehydropantoate 2-reductase [Vibrio ulleungensis]|uniref:2-dehydropantoate 2-reductase n=1 Tax=Vibrio ulleungensis TaxID=2807619 RepID=A0ABS2HFX8_9VIBR|nr:2-dehydropantoate 2-reductase [Vibrio ulleungensis]MBM7036450.1 2-dehydropantoate 2-reductase [Vibrio ulleungensis]
MNISIVGAGAIGSLWAYNLAHAGHNVSLFTRDDQPLCSIQLDQQSSLSFSCNQWDALEQCDLLLVTVKAWQVNAAITPFLSRLDTNTIIMFMHNGMGALDPLNKQLDGYPVVQATTTHGALLLSKSVNSVHVSHTGAGETQMGGYNHLGHRCDFLAEVFNHALPKALWHANISPLLWNKLAINCAINPLTAIYDCTNGELAKPEFDKILHPLCDELSAVMQTQSVEVSTQQLLLMVQRVIKATANNFSSMHQDIQHSRTTEIDYITGHILDVAQREGIDVPVHQSLYTQVKELESSFSNINS